MNNAPFKELTAEDCAEKLKKLGYNVEPKYNDERIDIVQSILFNDEEKLIKYVQ